MSNHQPPKKSLGQHWLNDQASLQAMCEAAQINHDDVVLEIGPGQGSLTNLLTKSVSRVVAIEKDERLAASLPKAANLEVIGQDILQFDFTSLPPKFKIVANIPYYLTSNLIRVISESSNPPSTAVLLVQKEVAERVAAQPGDMSILSVTAQFYWHVSLGQLVPAYLFEPPPKIDSQILILERRQKPVFDVRPQDFFRLVKIGFAQRRKTLLNNLSNGLQLSRTEVEKICDKVAISPSRRAQTLTLEEWYKLYTQLAR